MLDTVRFAGLRRKAALTSSTVRLERTVCVAQQTYSARVAVCVLVVVGIVVVDRGG